MSKGDIEHFYPKTKQHWRKWLEKNHIKKDAVWLMEASKRKILDQVQKLNQRLANPKELINDTRYIAAHLASV